MNELTPGYYTVISAEGLLERSTMNTLNSMNITGKYYNGEPLAIYQVYPSDKSGIVWGRVSMTDELSTRRFVALIVNNHPKVKYEGLFPERGQPRELIQAIERLNANLERLFALLPK